MPKLRDFDDPEIRAYQDFVEITHGRMAMFGIVAACVSYGVTGQIIPGIF